MEVDVIKRMFSRSVEKFGVTYPNCVKDGDSNTYYGISNSDLYGDDNPVVKNECVGYIEKRMSTRLRSVKKKITRWQKEIN